MSAITTASAPRRSGALARIIDEADQDIRNDITQLRAMIDDSGVSGVMLVIDRNAVDTIGIGASIERQLEGVVVTVFDRFSPNPTSEQAADAAREAIAQDARLVVGVGGGSCLDVAKVSAMAASRPGLVDELARGEGTDRADPLPIIAAPTTSGTGSETTHFSAIYVNGRKVSVTHRRIRPRGVILDPSLHGAMPASVAAVTGLDALGQAMESLWAVGSTEESRDYARRAGELIGESITRSVNEADSASRTAMMCGAHLAGRAINISKTTASHAMSYQLTKRFGIPHGHGVALTLGHVGAYNAGVGDECCADPRGVRSVRERVEEAAHVLGVAPEGLPEAVGSLLVRLGLPANLRAAGVDRASIPELASTVDPVRLGNNPRRMSSEDLSALLDRAWDS